MKPFTLATVVLFHIILISCSRPNGPAQPDYSQDVEAINALLAEHIEAVNSGDVDANLAGMSKDLIYMPPGQALMRGRDTLEPLLRSFYDSFDAEINMIPEETVVAGDWAFQWGLFSGIQKPLAGGDSTVLNGKYMYIYQRQPDRTWRIARDIYNSNVSPKGSQ